MHVSAEVREGRRKEEGTSWFEVTDRGKEREQLWENKRRLWS